MRFVNTKTIILVVIIIILLLIIKNIVSSIITLRQNSEIVTTLRKQELAEKEKKRFLSEQLHYVTTPQYIESVAREKLGMVKAGEYIVLAPPTVDEKRNHEKVEYLPTWKKWWKLFF